MNLRKRLDVHLHPDEYDLLERGEPLQIPIDDQIIVVFPPEETETEQGESETDYMDSDGIEDLEVEQ